MSVTVYADADYLGRSAVLGAGRHTLDPSMDDVISSVRITDGWTATLYEHADFTGRQLTLEADTPKLDGALDDKASAIVITRPAGEEQDFDEDDFIVFQS
ncbi:peptidase inhibitor family I36 protein [Streptomyces sp. NPDC056488]|uniref:peptidase inhibitor family I36 protein n=1 Tax=Streptomyces sp. NPDC056488 TaxID=3345836 RepID=UPI0036BF0F07